LQKGLVPKTKAETVANYATGVINEVETLAHSVGVTEPRGIRRKHIRVMQASGRSISLARLYPRPDVLPGN
jgi:glutamate synthase domain-containing protein 2